MRFFVYVSLCKRVFIYIHNKQHLVLYGRKEYYYAIIYIYYFAYQSKRSYAPSLGRREVIHPKLGFQTYAPNPVAQIVVYINRISFAKQYTNHSQNSRLKLYKLNKQNNPKYVYLFACINYGHIIDQTEFSMLCQVSFKDIYYSVLEKQKYQPPNHHVCQMPEAVLMHFDNSRVDT